MITLWMATAMAQVPCNNPLQSPVQVDVPGDHPSIDAAVSALEAAGMLNGATIVVAAGTWPANSTIDGADVTIVGSGCGNTTIQATAGPALTFLNSTSAIYDVQFTGDAFTRAVQSESSTLQIHDSCFVDLVTPDPDDGAGIYATQSNLCLVNDTFDNNKAHDGGGLAAFNGPTNFVHFVGGTFTDNLARNHGAGAFIEGGTVYSQSLWFTTNTADQRGGGLALDGVSADLNSTVFVGNAAKIGGGLDAHESDLDLQSSGFTSNTATYEGAGAHFDACFTATIVGTEFMNNTADSSGGGIDADGSHLEVRGGSFTGNRALSRYGGAIQHLGTQLLDIDGGYYTDNTAAQYGGAIHYDAPSIDGEMRISNADFRRNRAGTGNLGEGGALSIVRAGSAVLRTNRFIENAADGTGPRRGGAIRAVAAQEIHGYANWFCQNKGTVGAAAFLNGTQGSSWNGNIFANHAEHTWGGTLAHLNGGDLYFVGNTTVGNEGVRNGAIYLNAPSTTAITMEDNIIAWDSASSSSGGAVYASTGASAPLVAGWSNNACHDNTPNDFEMTGAPPTCVYTGVPTVPDPAGVDCADFTAADFVPSSTYNNVGADPSLVPIP